LITKILCYIIKKEFIKTKINVNIRNKEVKNLLLTLIGKEKMHKLRLPQLKFGSYWLTDKSNEKKLINIEGIDGKWQIISNSRAQIIDLKAIDNNMQVIPNRSNIIDKIVLEENQMYGVCLENSKDVFILYCSPGYDDNFVKLNIKTKQDIFIGSNKNNNIFYKNKFVEDRHARIFFYDGRWRIEDLNSRLGTFVNSRIIEGKEKILFNGDIAFIMGLRIIIVGDNMFINNPNKKVFLDDNCFSINKDKIKIYADNQEESKEELYSEEDYFSRAPRITNIIECEKVRIDAPPQIQDKEEMPLILMLGSSLSMGAMMLVSIMTTIDGRMSGTTTIKQTIFSLITSGAMLIGMILFPILIAKYNRKKKKRYEEKRQKRYKEYLSLKEAKINKIKNKQRSILFENYASPEECTNIIFSKSSRLWERKIDNYDFLKVRLGIGDVPLNIEVQYPEERFSMEDDNLIEILNNIVNESKTLELAPITISLAEKNISAIITEENKNIKRFMQTLIIQLIALQSYEDLKLVFLLKKDTFKNWEYVKMFPHIWNNSKQIRFFAEDYEDMVEISNYLEEELRNRQEHKDKDYKSFMPYYLIITDDYKKIENLKIIKEILKSKTNVGFSILCITNDLMQLPNECKTFISLEDDKTGMIFENEISSTNQKQITFDTSVIIFFEKISQIISNIPIKYRITGNNTLPNNYPFLEMYDVGCIEQLNILDRWKNNDSTVSLKAPIGIDGSGVPVILDIHEKFHGPHGLIAGSTGSGKSEFIITYILSLAINYHPEDVSFILIDYKGGGLAGAFKKREIKLPHLVGTITNIDTNGLQRSLTSIQSELRRRQVIFNEARNMTDEGTIDIYKYQKMYHEGIVKEPIPHLLIICDEFAELKQQQATFMDELMSVARIGRSLGVHLILATQKPAGIVNDQIRSNSKFAICLRVQDKADSNDVIKRPDAANLKNAGQFYMQVGNDEYFVLGQSAWAGAPYFPTNIVEKKVDNSIQFVSNIGYTIKRADDTTQKVASNNGEQLTNVVKYLHNMAKQEGINMKNLWLDDIPETIYVKQLRKKYGVNVKENSIIPVIGEYDDPNNQRQGIVTIDLLEQGNTIIYGNAESGKETLLSTMIYDLITTHSSNEVQLYLLDFGTEALKIYKEAPQVGDIVFANDSEKTSRFFDMIQQEINRRKSILSDYNGDYELYLKTSKNELPMITVIINNYETFSELYENIYDDILLSITREGIKCGIVFIFTANSYSDMRYRLTQNFKQKIGLQLNNEDDYFNIFEKVGKKRPTHIFGRGLISLEDGNVYEFQTAKVCDAEEYNSYLRKEIEKIKENSKDFAKPIPTMPDIVAFEDVKDYLKNTSCVPLGITKKDLKVFTYNFKKNFMSIIASRNLEDAIQFTINIIELMKNLKDTEIVIFDAEKAISTQKNNLKEEYIKFIEASGQIKKDNILCIIIGIDKFLSDFEGMQNYFKTSLKELEAEGRYNFIIVDNANKLKSHEYDEWYKNYISKDNGIWVGNGLDNQYLITINSNRREIVNRCGRSFGYVIDQGFIVLIKLLGMKEFGDEYE